MTFIAELNPNGFYQFSFWVTPFYPSIFNSSAAAAKSLQSCLTLCNPMDGSPPSSPIPGILQARTLEWLAISFSNAWKWKVKSESEVAQSCPTLSDPMDCNPPGSSVHGIFPGKGTGLGCHYSSGYYYLNTCCFDKERFICCFYWYFH